MRIIVYLVLFLKVRSFFKLHHVPDLIYVHFYSLAKSQSGLFSLSLISWCDNLSMHVVNTLVHSHVALVYIPFLSLTDPNCLCYTSVLVCA